MGYDLSEEAIDPERPRWLILREGFDADGKRDESQDAGFLVHSEYGVRGREVKREAQEKYGRALAAGGDVAERATQAMTAHVAAGLVADVRNVTVDGRALTADFDDLFAAFNQPKFLMARGRVIMFARDDGKYRPIDEAGAGN